MALVVKYIERCMRQGALTMSHLSQIEKKVLEEMDFATFHDMGQGHFLEFLLQNEAVKKVNIIQCTCSAMYRLPNDQCGVF